MYKDCNVMCVSFKFSTINNSAFICRSTLKQPHPKLQRAVSFETSHRLVASERTPLLSSSGRGYRGSSAGDEDPDVEISDPSKKQKEPSLLRTLAILYGPTLLRAHACKLICDIMTFLGPAIQRFVNFTKKCYNSSEYFVFIH